MRLGIISLFPEMFNALHHGITGRAIINGYINIKHWNPRDYVNESACEISNLKKYHSVDDRPYGGGPGMVMRAKPIQNAIKAAKLEMGDKTTVVHLSPQGKLLTQESVVQLAQEEKFILVASRYEGVDERLLESEIDQEWSIGDYVLTGGELPIMVLIDAMSRHISGVLGHQESAKQDSFSDGLLDCPHYTRPEEFANRPVPKILLEGNHQAIANWRLQQALGRTWLRRPDLLQKRVLTPIEQQLLNDFISDNTKAEENFHE